MTKTAIQKAIEERAEYLCPKIVPLVREVWKEGYITAATEERERAKVLVDELERIVTMYGYEGTANIVNQYKQK